LCRRPFLAFAAEPELNRRWPHKKRAAYRSGMDIRATHHRNHGSPRMHPPRSSSLLDRPQILGAELRVGCGRGWCSGRNAVPPPTKETPPVRKFKVSPGPIPPTPPTFVVLPHPSRSGCRWRWPAKVERSTISLACDRDLDSQELAPRAQTGAGLFWPTPPDFGRGPLAVLSHRIGGPQWRAADTFFAFHAGAKILF
jgi:hypothetical protein